MERLKDNSDVPEARHGTLPKILIPELACIWSASGSTKGPDSEMQVVRSSLSFSQVLEQCQLRWESLQVSRRLSGQGDINSRSCE